MSLQTQTHSRLKNVTLARFEDEATVPKFYFFRDGLGLFFPGQGTSLEDGRVPNKVAVEQGCII